MGKSRRGYVGYGAKGCGLCVVVCGAEFFCPLGGLA